MTKKIILAIVVIILITIGIYQVFLKEKRAEFALIEVVRGNITQEIFESGQVGKGEKINLAFENAGRIEKIYATVGQEVKPGEILAELEKSRPLLQLKEAKANLEAQKIRLIELQKGTRVEEIQISEVLLNKAKTELDNLYKDIPILLNQAYNLAESAIRRQIAGLFFYKAEARPPYYELTYRYCNDQAANDSTFQRKICDEKLTIWRSELRNLKDGFEIFDSALAQAESYLLFFQNFLSRLNDTLIINQDCRLSPGEIDKINTNKSVVSSALTDVNTALTSIYSQEKAIRTQKLIIQNYQEQLNLKLAGATPEQIAYQEVQIQQVKAKIALLENQIEETILKSPISGQITKILKTEGELVQPTPQDVVMVMLPLVPYEIKVDVYEENVVKISVGNPVEISLVAFPKETFKGKITSISPAEKIIEGVVYYEITIAFEEESANIKPGMTADVIIQTDFKEDILIIPRDLVQSRDGKTIVEVFKNGLIEEREIEIGIRGADGMVEALSGLEEGEKVIQR